MPSKIKGRIFCHEKIMNDRLEYIDSYFQGHLHGEELELFDKKVLEDPEFANDVSFYITSVHALRNEIMEEKKNRFREIYQTELKRPSMWKYVAAAAVIAGLAFSISLFFPSRSADVIADKYIRDHLATLGVLMTSEQDTLQNGITLYNEGKYRESYLTFKSILDAHPTDHKALEYAGIISLQLGDFDKALQHFETLAQMTHLYANPGKFYVSLTLLKRNQPADVKRAKTLLQQLVQEGGAKQQAARELLAQF